MEASAKTFPEMMESLLFWDESAPHIRVIRTPDILNVSAPYLAHLCRGDGVMPHASDIAVVLITAQDFVDIKDSTLFFTRNLMSDVMGTAGRHDDPALKVISDAAQLKAITSAIPIIKIDALSGVIIEARGDGTEMWNTVAMAVSPPSLFTPAKVAACIKAHMEDIHPGIMRSLDGTLFFYDVDFEMWRQVAPNDPEAVMTWMENADYVSENAEKEEIIAAALPLVGLNCTLVIFEYLEAITHKQDPHEEVRLSWERWGHEVFTKSPTSSISIAGSDGETSVYTITDADIFGDIWDEMLRSAEHEDEIFMVLQRIPTAMRDVNTGEDIIKMSGFMLSGDGFSIIPMDKLKRGFSEHPEDGSPLAAIPGMIFKDFQP